MISMVLAWKLYLSVSRISGCLTFCTPVLFAEQNMIITRKKSLGLDDVFVNSITHVKEAKNKKINVINCWKEQVKTDLGKSSIEAGKYAFTSLKKATQSLKKKKLMF